MLINQRVIWSNNGSLVDMSIETNDLFSGTKVIDLTYNQDYIYIGSDLPFNHRYFQISVANAIASVASVDIWDGSTWNPAVDVLDQTAASGASMAQSGILSWTTDESKSWVQEKTTENIAALSTLKIYDLHWVRLSWSASWTGTTAISYIGHKFADDNTLTALYPDLGRTAVKTAHTSGKTTWNDQSVLASEMIIAQLRKERILWSGSQIFSWEMFQIAQVHKTAHLVYSSFGEAKKEERDEAKKQYDEAMNQITFPNQDKNADGHLDTTERFNSIRWVRG
jgi:hypothetical protein